MCTIDVRIVLYKSDIKIRELPVFCIMVVYFYCDSSEVYSVLGALPGGRLKNCMFLDLPLSSLVNLLICRMQ